MANITIDVGDSPTDQSANTLVIKELSDLQVAQIFTNGT